MLNIQKIMQAQAEDLQFLHKEERSLEIFVAEYRKNLAESDAFLASKARVQPPAKVPSPPFPTGNATILQKYNITKLSPFKQEVQLAASELSQDIWFDLIDSEHGQGLGQETELERLRRHCALSPCENRRKQEGGCGSLCRCMPEHQAMHCGMYTHN